MLVRYTIILYIRPRQWKSRVSTLQAACSFEFSNKAVRQLSTTYYYCIIVLTS
jgi:hypothetical protein